MESAAAATAAMSPLSIALVRASEELSTAASVSESRWPLPQAAVSDSRAPTRPAIKIFFIIKGFYNLQIYSFFSENPPLRTLHCKKTPKNLQGRKKALTFAAQSNGVLAHLARARHWQCRGERFESAILHQQRIWSESEFAFLLSRYKRLYLFFIFCRTQISIKQAYSTIIYLTWDARSCIR